MQLLNVILKEIYTFELQNNMSMLTEIQDVVKHYIED